MDRRQLLITTVRTGAAAGIAGGAVMLDPVAFAAAAAPAPPQSRTITGHIDYGAPDWVYVPLDIPAGVNRLTVAYSYDRPAAPPGQNGNALDIGLFDEHGTGLGDERGFRGWSGGFRTEYTVSASDATPGYLPGPVRAGRWHIILGPYTVHPQGLNWTVTVTLTFGPDGPAFRPSPAPQRARGRGAEIGQRLAVADDEPVTVTLKVTGAGGSAARLVTDQGQRLATVLPADGPGTVTWTTTPRNARYVRAEVRRPQPTPTTADQMVALTNPIFLGRL